MSKSGDLHQVVRLVRAHGYREVIRAVSYLWGVAQFIKAHDRAPRSRYELGQWWHEPLRTTQREGAAWEAVTGGADVAAVAREVLSDLGGDSSMTQDLGEAERLRLVPYLADLA